VVRDYMKCAGWLGPMTPNGPYVVKSIPASNTSQWARRSYSQSKETTFTAQHDAKMGSARLFFKPALGECAPQIQTPALMDFVI